MSSDNAGNFFAIDANQWPNVCAIGINQAVAFLTLARGTGRDNVTTSWSADAVARYAGISWRRAKLAIGNLEEAKIITRSGSKTKPRYKLPIAKGMENLIWLPNALVSGAVDETPPLTRIRQCREIEVMQTFIELYSEHDLPGDGGLPRNLIVGEFQREKLMEMAQFTLYGFNRTNMGSTMHRGPFRKYAGRKVDAPNAMWAHISILEDLGLLETIDYLAEDKADDSELIHALNGDHCATDAAKAAFELAESIPDCYECRAAEFDYVIPVIRHMVNATVVKIYRLRYRPRTRSTSAWYAQHVEACRQYADLYHNIHNRADIKGNQGISKVVKGLQGG